MARSYTCISGRNLESSKSPGGWSEIAGRVTIPGTNRAPLNSHL
jgi:hypothetical protein